MGSMSASPAIYLDNNATTQVDERVLEAMLPALEGLYGNPSSVHGPGEEAAGAVEGARGAVARLLGARSPEQVVFTSGGTESIHTAHFDALDEEPRGTVLTTATEHSAVASSLERYEPRGTQVEQATVDAEGRVQVDELVARVERLGEACRLVTLHLANNETGVRLTDEELARLAATCRAAGVPLHLDAVQAPGKLALRVDELGVDYVSISGHKFHGPKGIGALYVRRGTDGFRPLLPGGGQEADRRGGTHNVPGILGIGRAAELAREHVEDPAGPARVRALRDRLEAGLLERVPRVRVHGGRSPRLDNTTNLGFDGLDGEVLRMSLAAEGLAISGGSACSAHRRAPSHVLLAMGLDPAAATSAIRFSLSRRTRDEEIEATLDLVPRVVADCRALEAV